MSFSLESVFVYVATYLFIALFGAVILSRVNTDIGRQLEVRYFRLLVGALILYCINDSLWALGQFGYSPLFARLLLPLTIGSIGLINALCYFWFCYLESYLQSRVANTRKWRIVAAIPLALSLALLFTTPWTGLVAYIGPEGTVERGPLHLPIIYIAYAYAITAAVRSSRAALKETDRQRKTELITMSLFIIPPALIGVVDTLVPNMPVVAPAFFFSLLIIFTMLQEGQISTDSLTGLNNRRRGEAHFDEVLAQVSPKKPQLFLIIDANNFKQINDTYGHLEGDNALCIIADSLRDACRNSAGFIARWGGDEFIVIVPEEDVNSAEDFMNLIDNCLLYEAYEHHLPYKLNVTIGHARITDEAQSKKLILEAADRMLYEEKRKLHRQ